MPRASLLVVLALLVALPLYAQQPVADAVRATLRTAAQARLVQPEDVPFPLATERRGATRVDTRTGVVRADYRITERLAAPSDDPEAAARRYLTAQADRYGLDPSLADLVVERVVSGAYSHHVVFRQTVDGIPVFARTVQVNLDRNRQPVLVTSAYERALRGLSVPARRVSPADARLRTSELLTEQPATVDVQEEMVTPDGRRVWRVVTVPAGVPVEWEVLLDASTGAVRYVFERSTHGLGGAGRTVPPASRAFPFARGSAAGAAVARADGTGFVFDPDPLSTAGVPYGAPGFVDGTQRDAQRNIIEADTPELNAQRRLVTLRDIAFVGGRYTLDGPYVRIVGDDPSGAITYSPPQPTQPDGFRFTRAEDGFEAVMVYYHVDQSQRHVQGLDVGRAVLERPVPVNPHGYTADDSRFFPSSGRIFFGTGAIDDAEDAGVVWHEYAHALLHDGQPALYQATDGTALHEGWADYWAGSYRRSTLGDGAAWRQLFPWDGNNPPNWCGRQVDHPGTWPSAWAYSGKPGCLPLGSIYQKGLLWATTLMEVYDALGHDVTDRLSVASHAFIGVVPGVSAFEAAAEALVAADQTLYGSAYRGVLLGVLGARGYLDAETYGPVVDHTPLVSTEQAGGSRDVEVIARGPGAVIEEVRVVYRYDMGAPQSVTLTAQGGDRYAGAVPLPSGSATVSYFVEARDVRGRATRLPVNPAEVFSFSAGPDVQPPQIVHAARERVPLAAWPPDVRAIVTDNLGVDTVMVTYTLVGAQGGEKQSGVFGLVPEGSGVYAVRWPLPASAVSVGDTVRYRIVARDVARAPNTATLPGSAPFTMEIVAQGVLAAFSFETPGDGVEADGVWARGTPAFGLRQARTGQHAWMTGLDAAYPETRTASALTLPALDLQGDPAVLAFWHWYDLEAGGQCRTACDGAAIEVSTDGGTTWSTATPLGGYPATVDPSNTRLGGQGAWSGYSYGWQRAVVPLPQAADVRVRFVLATDAGNIYPTRYGYAGWAIDDVEITTRFVPDVLPPYAEVLPEARQVGVAGVASVPFEVEARDETGVVRVEVRAAYGRDGTTRQDTLRLEQRPDRLDRFTGTLALDAPARPGDVLAYTLLLVDADGNTRTYPTTGAFIVQYRIVAQADVLAGASATGRWTAAGAAWTVAATGAAKSSLVLPPQDLPANAETIRYVLRHAFMLGSGVGGRLVASVDDGRTWQTIEPEAGYPAEQNGTGIFAGIDTLASVVDLTALAGRQVRLRLDFDAGRPLEPGEFWRVDAFTRYTDTDDEAFEVPRVFALHAVHPHPVRETATLAYTLDKDARVTLDLYDVLGRRVATLVDRQERAAGTYPATLDASALASGVYVLRLQAGAQQQTRQVVVVR